MKNFTFKTLLFGLALLGLGTASYHRSALQAPEVANKTTAIRVVSVTSTEDGGTVLQLQNISRKNINGYSIGTETAYKTADLTSGDRVISPDEEFTVRVPSRRETLIPRAPIGQTTTIRYVIFDDDSCDGDAVAAQELQDIRAGKREQLRRIVPLMQATAASADLAQLETELKALPEEGRKTDRSFNVATGRRAAKQDALLELSKIDKSNVRAELIKLTEQNNRHVIRLTKREKP